jgi:hypothetical protein
MNDDDDDDGDGDEYVDEFTECVEIEDYCR